MDEDRYQRAKELFLAACDLPPEEREAMLQRQCAGDAELRADVESLLTHDAPTAAVGRAPIADVTPEKPQAMPRTIGPYRVSHELGRGGMGIIYLGAPEAGQFKRRVAIKVLKRGTDTERVLHRFELERQVLSAMNHPGIARLYDAGETDDGVPYFVMEYVDGLPLGEYCDAHRLHIDERLELFRKVCAAVHYAHQNLVVHRDLKPSNIIVTADGQPKLLDFGIAKLVNPEMSLISGSPTAPEFRVLTPEYASPEQVRGGPITTASDVYSLGVLLYELVSGHRPYRLRSRVRAELERVICEEDPEKPSTAISRIEETEPNGTTTTTKTITPESVSKTREDRPERLRRRLAGDIDNIVLMAMRKEPQRRYASAEQLAEDIDRHLRGLTVHARRDTLGYRTAKFIRRNRGGVAAAAIIVLLLIAGIAGTSWGWQVAVREGAEAEQARAGEAQQREIAQEQSDRAQRHFDQVRSLAHTFMFEIHDSIKDLDGSLKARELLVSTALEYLGALARDVGDDAELQRYLASCYARVGDIQGGVRTASAGDLESALICYRTAEAIQLKQMEAAPADETLRKELSSTYLRIGDILKRTGDTRGALDMCQASLAIREALAATKPEDPSFKRHLAVALSSVGGACAKLGDDAAALAHYERSLALRQQLAAERPDDLELKDDLATIHHRIGGRLKNLGDHEAALRRYEEAIAIRRQLIEADADNSTWRRGLAVLHYSTGKLLLLMDEPEAALDHLNQYLSVTEQRAADNPDSARAKRDLGSAYEIIAGTKGMMGDWEAALEDYRTLQSIVQPLVGKHPEDTQYLLLLAVSYEGIAQALAELNDLPGAIEQAREAGTLYEQLAEADPDDARRRGRVPAAMARLGIWLAEAGQPGEAIEQLQAARQLYETLSEDETLDASDRAGFVTTLHELSRLMARLEDGEAALDFAQQAVDLTEEPVPQLLRDFALAHHLTGDDARAITIASEALQQIEEDQDPESAELRTLLEEDLHRYRGE